MAKKKSAVDLSQGSLFRETGDIIASLDSGKERHVLAVLAIPSHDRRNRKLADGSQGLWADSAMDLFARIFGGATGFNALAGSFWSEEQKKVLLDQPVLIQSYAARRSLEDHSAIEALVRFIKRMGNEMDQECVMLVIDDVVHFISDYSGIE